MLSILSHVPKHPEGVSWAPNREFLTGDLQSVGGWRVRPTKAGDPDGFFAELFAMVRLMIRLMTGWWSGWWSGWGFECVLNVFWMCFECVLNVFWMCFECVLNVFWMCFWCTWYPNLPRPSDRCEIGNSGPGRMGSVRLRIPRGSWSQSH